MLQNYVKNIQLDNIRYLPFVILNAVKNLLKAADKYARL